MIRGLGTRLCNLRESRDLSQRDVARVLDVTPGLISNYETGERTPSVENLVALATFFRCTTDYLLGLDDKKSDVRIDVGFLNDDQIERLTFFLESLY